MTDLKDAFTNLVDVNCFWLGTRSIDPAKRKIRKMKLYSGYPIWLKNVSALNTFYDGVKTVEKSYIFIYQIVRITYHNSALISILYNLHINQLVIKENSTYLQNQVAIARYSSVRELKQYGTKKDLKGLVYGFSNDFFRTTK